MKFSINAFRCTKGLRTLLRAAIIVAATCLASCEEEETNIGLGLQDPASLFSGQRDTVLLNGATFYDDSLLTSGYSRAVIGQTYHTVFGTTTASYNTQIANKNGLDWDEHCTIDSVVLQLAVEDVYAPHNPAGQDVTPTVVVKHLAEKIMTDSAYYSFSNIAKDELYASRQVRITDSMLNRVQHDSLITLSIKLDTSVFRLFPRRQLTAAELIDVTKGISVELNNTLSPGNPIAMTLNLAAATTKMAIYYTYANGSQNISRTLDMNVGSGATHFSTYTHDYKVPFSDLKSGTLDSLPGGLRLYLEPLGGTYLKLDMSSWVKQFRQKHPAAVIAYAVIKLPVAPESEGEKPSKLYTYKNYADGSSVLIPDFMDTYRLTGYDGTNNIDSTCYRIRVTEHVQKMLHSGNDFGTLIYLEGRRSDPRSVIFNGTATSNPPKLEIVYSE